ncbi:MAG: TPM domain-containing protein [Solitalea-like symbiont of Acarus siro]
MMYISKKIKYLTKIIVLALAIIIFAAPQKSILAQDIVKPFDPPRLVNDYTSTLTSMQKRDLEAKLLDLEKATSVQTVVVIIPTLNGYDASDYAVRLGEKWGVGTKKDNGIVFLTSLGDRKTFIATGYGIEDILPDAYTKRILTQYVTPNYKNGNIYAGVSAGVDNIISIVEGKYEGTGQENKAIKTIGIPGIAIALFIIIMIVVIKTTSSQFYHLTSPKNNHHTAGGEGKLMSWLLLSMFLNKNRGHKNIWNDFNSGSGNSFGDSDGFGGFGGGRFGGGGSGDNW